LRSKINRHGFLEETHFTVAYSPVPDESMPSGIGGVLATVHEITDKIVAERRVVALRDLARAIEAKSAQVFFGNSPCHCPDILTSVATAHAPAMISGASTHRGVQVALVTHQHGRARVLTASAELRSRQPIARRLHVVVKRTSSSER
jgi:hypothetical protein